MYRYGEEEIQAVERVLRGGQWFRYGDSAAGHLGEAAAFEAEWSSLMGSEFACFTSSGTAALMCCYAGLKLGPGDEVIVPGYTWMATALAPLHLGAIPVVVDVDRSLTLDPDAVERAITPRTRAISPVHMNGFMADLDRLEEIASRHGLLLVEDSCQCDGGRWYDGRRAGTAGEVGAYSFNFYKMISCGEGGMFVTDRRDVYERGLMYHDAGSMFRPYATESSDFFTGINLRGNEILAALMRVQLSRLDGIISDLLRNRQSILKRIEGAVEHIPCNGGYDTGTGSYLGLQFSSTERARAFSDAFNRDADEDGAVSYLLIDSGRHVYSEWKPLLEKRGAHVEAADPFQHPLNRGAPTYSAEMLPRTLEILRTTVVVGINPDWSEEQCDRIAAGIRVAAA